MNYLEAFNNIQTFVFDVDGVLTDGTLLVTEAGELLRTMNIKDGYGIKRAIQEGYRVVIITGGKSKGVASRLQALGVRDIFIGQEDKLESYEDLVERYALNEGAILYMGDDLPDYPVMRRVGLPCCPSDAVPEIMEICRYISPLKGGAGCVRDVIEKVLRLHGKWGI